MNAKIIMALALVAVGSAVGVTSFRKSVTPYVSLAEARRAAGLVQVNGVIADRNYVIKPLEQYMEFNLKDQKGEVMPIVYHGVIPGNFDQATMVVAVGRYRDGRFLAEQLLVKCPSKYQAEAEKQKAGRQ
jgi:cytochrome c-type biogenesis protein CcmE